MIFSDKEVSVMMENAIKYVKQIFADDCSGHDFHHTMRVYRLAIQIAKQENADLLIVVRLKVYHRPIGGIEMVGVIVYR